MGAVLTANDSLSQASPAFRPPRPPLSPTVVTGLCSKNTYRKEASWSTIGLIALSHALGIYFLLQIDSIRESVIQPPPLIVSLITETKPEKTPEAPPLPKKLMMVRDIPAPLMPPVIEIETPQVQTQPTITQALAKATPGAPEAKSGPVKPQEIIPPNFVAAYLDNPAPVYPSISKRMREQGTVILRVMVTPEGRAEVVEIQTSSGSPRLDDAAQTTVKKWRFVPARQGSQALASWVLVPIDFQLTS